MNLSAISIQTFFGVFLLIGLTRLFSEDKKIINWKLIIYAFILQNILFLGIHYIPFIHQGLRHFSHLLIGILDSANYGASQVFGNFVDRDKYGFVFTLVVVPILIFIGALIGILYFLGIIQWLIHGLAFLLRRSIKLSGVESLVIIADIFLGQSEGPLVIGPYIKSMTRSELALAFTAGLANISGSTLVIYLIFLANNNPAESDIFANYLITASFMNAVSAIIFSKILFPENNFENVSSEKIKIIKHSHSSLIDSIYQGVMNGLRIGATLIAFLIAITSLIHMIDSLLSYIGNITHINNFIKESSNSVFNNLSVEYILGQLFRIFAFFMGISWSETLNVGSLLGQKVALNELIAYISLSKMKTANLLSQHAVIVSTFALASFSNFSSIGISLGAFSVLAPSRQKELSTIAWKCLFGAVMAGFLTATIASFWINILK